MENYVAQIVENVQYNSLSDLARHYGLKPTRIQKRYSRGYAGDDLIPKRLRKNYTPPVLETNEQFIVGKLTFKNRRQACKELGISYNTYRSRIRSGWSEEEALNIIAKTDGRKSGKKFKKNENKKLPLILYGREFVSYKELENFTKIPAYVLSQRVNKYGMSLEEAVVCVGKNKKIVCDGRHTIAKQSLQ